MQLKNLNIKMRPLFFSRSKTCTKSNLFRCVIMILVGMLLTAP
jgi:hypothetical protein